METPTTRWVHIGSHLNFLMKLKFLAVYTLTNDLMCFLFAVALSYSVQIQDEAVPVDSTDVNIDALVSSTGVLSFSQQAREKMSSS